MAKKVKAQLTDAEKLLRSKRRLIEKLKRQIVAIRQYADVDVAKIQSRMRIAETIADALEKGTLKP